MPDDDFNLDVGETEHKGSNVDAVSDDEGDGPGSAVAGSCTKGQTGLPFKLRRVDHCERCGVPFQEPGTFAWDTVKDEYILIPCPQCGSEPNETYEERSKRKWRRATAYR